MFHCSFFSLSFFSFLLFIRHTKHVMFAPSRWTHTHTHTPNRALCCCLCSNCGYCCYDEKRMADKERRLKRKRQQEELRAQQMALQEPYYVRSNSLHNNLHSPEKQIQIADVESISTTESRTSMHGLSILAPILLCMSMMTIYVLFGALALIRLEGWPFIKAIYFCFMSLSTVGFGDILPGLHKESTTTTWFCSIYIMCGMALTAMCYNVLHQEIAYRLRTIVDAKQKISHIQRAATDDPNDFLASWRYEKNTNLYHRNPTEETLITGKFFFLFLLSFVGYDWCADTVAVASVDSLPQNHRYPVAVQFLLLEIRVVQLSLSPDFSIIIVLTHDKWKHLFIHRLCGYWFSLLFSLSFSHFALFFDFIWNGRNTDITAVCTGARHESIECA